METRKKIQYFKVKWANIAERGCTWEPAAHFVGDPAKAALSAFRQKRVAEQAAVDAARAERRAGKRPADNEAGDVGDADDDVQAVHPKAVQAAPYTNKFRKKQSEVWKFFEGKVFDSVVGAYVAKCKICGINIKALNTTNLKAHLNSLHPKEMVTFKVQNNKVTTFV